MAEITLYTHERPGAGLTSTNVCRVKGVVALRIVTDERTLNIPLQGRQASSITPDRGVHPVGGKADLHLQIAGQEQVVDLAKRRWVVALVVTSGANQSNPTTIYRLREGQCTEILERPNSGWARAEIEEHCCGSQYELPPPA